METFKKGDIVRFVPEYQDKEDDFDYILVEDPDGGRVKVIAINTGIQFPPIQVVKTDWLIKLSRQ